MLRVIANENIAGSLIRELRQRGHDIISVRELMPAGTDEEVLAKAHAESRIVLTHDKDFGELAFGWGLPSESGIILLRLSGSSPSHDNQRAIQALESREDWTGHFAVVTEDRIRMRPLPDES